MVEHKRIISSLIVKWVTVEPYILKFQPNPMAGCWDNWGFNGLRVTESQSHRVTELQTPKGTQHTSEWSFLCLISINSPTRFACRGIKLNSKLNAQWGVNSDQKTIYNTRVQFLLWNQHSITTLKLTLNLVLTCLVFIYFRTTMALVRLKTVAAAAAVAAMKTTARATPTKTLSKTSTWKMDDCWWRKTTAENR